uniref:Uncharacterized protein n=1 Tax=Megaselia scalaris TaxID=36166 RepID=T1GZK2_MEGSC
FAPAPQATASHASFASAPSREYLAPAHSAPQANFAPQPIAQPPAFTPAASEPLPAHSLSSDGYRYRTVRRRYRHRRAAPSNDYLPPLASEQHETFAASPSQQSSTIIAPPGVSAEAKLENRVVSTMEDSYAAAPSGAVAQSVEPAHSLESDGYHYKTVKRYRLRRRY